MNAFFAMGIPTTTDDRGYYLWAAQNLIFLVLPTIVFLTFLVAWVVQQIRACKTGAPGGSPPPTSLSETSEPPATPAPDWPKFPRAVLEFTQSWNQA